MPDKHKAGLLEPAGDDPLVLLARLCDQQGARAIAYAEAMLHDAMLAEEVVQGALISAWRAGVAGESNETSAALLLLGVVRRGVREMLVARRRRRRPAPSADLVEILGEHGLGEVRVHVESFPDGVLVANRDGRLLVANAVVRAGWTTPLPEVLDIHASARLDYRKPDGTPFPWAEQPLARALGEGRTVLAEPMLMSDSKPELLLVSATPVHDPHEVPIGAVALSRRAAAGNLDDDREGFDLPPARELAARLATLRGRIERNIEEVLSRPGETSIRSAGE